MKALVLETLNSPLQLHDVEPTPLKFGQVLIKVLRSGFCGAQLQEIKGHKGNGKFLPHLMGHEGCGIVMEIGDGVTTVNIGDKVVMHWRIGSGIESDFPQYILNGKIISSGKVTTLSEVSIVSENRVTKVPNDLPADFAALLGCCITTSFGVINNEAKVRFGENVLVLGCGGLGLSFIWGAKLANAGNIIGVDISEDKRKMAELLGATGFVNSREGTVKDYIFKDLGLPGIDVVIDTTGIPEVIAMGSELLSNFGRMILVAQPEPGKDITIPNASGFFGSNGKELISTQGGKTNPTEDIPRYVTLFNNSHLNYEALITEKVSLEDVNEAIIRLKAGKSGRIMVEISNE